MIPIKTKVDIAGIRKSAQLLVKTFKGVESKLKSDVTTETLDQVAEDIIYEGGGIPAFKGYRGYPASICISVDKEVVHGIPGKKKLTEGEVVSVDIGVLLDGYYSDASKSYAIGNVNQDKKNLLNTTKSALYRGIRQCRQGNRLTDISHAIQSYVESKGFSVVRALVGHGIGKALHEEPQIPNYGEPHRGPKLQAGMVFAIEPMVNMGYYEVQVLKDGWTVETKDGLPSAHFEHTILITEGKPEILTIGIEDDTIRSDYG